MLIFVVFLKSYFKFALYFSVLFFFGKSVKKSKYRVEMSLLNKLILQVFFFLTNIFLYLEIRLQCQRGTRGLGKKRHIITQSYVGYYFISLQLPGSAGLGEERGFFPNIHSAVLCPHSSSLLHWSVYRKRGRLNISYVLLLSLSFKL